MHDLAQVLVRGACGDRCLHEDLEDALTKVPLRGCYEDRVKLLLLEISRASLSFPGRRSWSVDIALFLETKQFPAAAVPIMSVLLLLASPTFISYPPHCLGLLPV